MKCQTTFLLQAVADAERQKAVLEIKIQEQRIKVFNIYLRVSAPLKQQQSPGRGRRRETEGCARDQGPGTNLGEGRREKCLDNKQ